MAGLQVVRLTLPLALYLDMVRLTARGLMRGPPAGHEAGEDQPADLSGSATASRLRRAGPSKITHRQQNPVITPEGDCLQILLSDLINNLLGGGVPLLVPARKQVRIRNFSESLGSPDLPLNKARR
jgi:hypothetical protein